MADFAEKKESNIKVVHRLEEVFQEVAQNLVTYTDWKFLARRLGLTDAELQGLVDRYRDDGRRETIYQMFCSWKSKTGKEANIPKLIRLLRAEQLHAAADLVCNYEIREVCQRCGGAGHRRCSQEAVPSHIVRKKSSLNLRREPTIITYPILPTIKYAKSRIDSGLSIQRQRTYSASSSTCSTPVPRRITRSSSLGANIYYASTPLPPISNSTTPRSSQFEDEYPEGRIDGVRGRSNDTAEESHYLEENETLHETEIEISNGTVHETEIEIRNGTTVHEDELNIPVVVDDSRDKPKTPQLKTNHTAEIDSKSDLDEAEVDTDLDEAEVDTDLDEAEVDTDPNEADGETDDIVLNGVETLPEDMEAQNAEDYGDMEEHLGSEVPPHIEKQTIVATVHATQLKPLPTAPPDPQNQVSTTTRPIEQSIPPSIAEMFKSMALHLYQTVVQSKDDHALALEKILELKNFLVTNIYFGSIKIEMQCYTREAYEAVRTKYENGEFLQACNKVFIRKELLKTCGIESVVLEADIEEFDDLPYFTEESNVEMLLDMNTDKNVYKDKAEKKKKDGRRPRTELGVSVEVKVKFQAQIKLDLNSSSIGQKDLDDRLRLGKARTFHKLLCSMDMSPGLIQQLNTRKKIKQIEFKRLSARGDFAEIIVECQTEESIQSFYNSFLNKELKGLLEKILLSQSVLRKAGLDDVTLDVEINSDHIERREKEFKEKMVVAKGTRYE